MHDLVDFECNRFDVDDTVVSVAIVGDEAISHMYNEFMNAHTTTDVISFNLSHKNHQCQEDFNDIHKEEDNIPEELGVRRTFGQRDSQPKNGF